MEGFHFTFIITICLCSMPVSSLFRDSPLPCLCPLSIVAVPSPSSSISCVCSLSVPLGQINLCAENLVLMFPTGREVVMNYKSLVFVCLFVVLTKKGILYLFSSN